MIKRRNFDQNLIEKVPEVSVFLVNSDWSRKVLVLIVGLQSQKFIKSEAVARRCFAK